MYHAPVKNTQHSNSQQDEADSGPLSEGSPQQEDLFPGLAPISEPPAQLKKAVGAIHIYPLNGAYSHLTRRVFNALLALASRHWSSLSLEQQAEVYDKRIVPRFKATIGDLKVVLGLSANDRGYDRIYEAIDCLYNLQFRFDVMGDHGPTWAVASRIVSEWAHAKDGSGRIEWEYPPNVFQLLMRPMPFARIDMTLANSLSSGYALALYENTCRYVNNPGQLTRKLPVEEWVKLVCTSSETNYKDEYRYFKRYVINRSLDELSASPACPLQLTLLETKGPRGKVTHLQFKVELKRQLPLPTEMGRGPDPRLVQAIRKLGVTEKKLNELIVSVDEADLQRCLDQTHQRMRRGNLGNPGGYFIFECQRTLELIIGSEEEGGQRALPGPAPSAAGNSKESKESKASANAAAFEAWRARRIREEFYGLSPEEQGGWVEEFKKHPSATPPVQDKIGPNGFGSTLAERVFFGWLLSAEGGQILTSPEDVSLESFCKAKRR